MELKKEKTLLVSYDGDGNRRGSIDLYTGKMYGVKGNELLGVPACFKGANLATYADTERALLKFYFEHRSSLLSYNKTIRQRFESLVSVGLIPQDMYCLLSDNWKPIKKAAINYFKEHERGIYSEQGLKRYELSDNPFFQTEHEEWVENAYFSLVITYHLPEKIVAQLLTRCELEHVINFYTAYNDLRDVVDAIRSYYNLSMKLYGTVTVERNFLTRLGFLRYTYNLRKNEIISEGLMKYNNDPRLAYEDDDFIVTYLLTTDDFHREGEAQRNCVERIYMEKVASGETKVVAIRKKNDPQKSFITCEVDNDGNINQYLYTYNHWVGRGTPEYDFRVAYQHHLQEVWNA